MKILYLPLHYLFSNDYGSELSWAYEVYTRIRARNSQTRGLVYYSLDKKNSSGLIYQKSLNQILIPSIWHTLKFPFFYLYHYLADFRTWQPDVIHHFLPFTIGVTFNPVFLLPFVKSKKIIGPVMVTMDNKLNRDLLPRTFASFLYVIIPSLLKPLLRILSKATLMSADIIIALNLSARDELIAFGIPRRKINIIPVGIDTKKFPYTPFEKKPIEKIKLISVGGLVERKGVDLLIRAFSKVHKQFSNVELQIVGQGPQESKLRELVYELNLQQAVSFAGFIPNDQLGRFYAQAHIFVSMSLAESWGQVYLEAMSSGLPVISTENLGSVEIVQEAKNGYLIKSRNVDEMTKKIIKLATNHKLLSELSQTSSQLADKKYSWEKSIVPEWIKYYRQ